MSFTIILALISLFWLLIVFGVAYKIKGLKVAFIITGIAAAVFLALYVVTIYLIASQMS